MMDLQIELKKTTDLTDEEIASIYDLFFEIFGKRRSVSLFKDQFLNTSRGYSYHSIAKDGDKIIGHNVYVPFEYSSDGTNFILALSVDAMVHPDYRGQGIYERLAKVCEEAAATDGCLLRIGFPNENSFPIQMKKFGYHHIGELSTYCLPLQMSGIKRQLGFCDFLVRGFSRGMLWLSKKRKSDEKIFESKIAPIEPNYSDLRFKWFNGEYDKIEDSGFTAYYKIDDFKGINAAFLLDVQPLSQANFDRAVKYLYDRLDKSVAIIIYVGNLPFKPYSLIKIPQKFSPKKFHFVGKALRNSMPSEHDWRNIKNWDISLSSFDLL